MKAKRSLSERLQALYERRIAQKRAKAEAAHKALRENGVSTANLMAQSYSASGGHGFAAKQR